MSFYLSGGKGDILRNTLEYFFMKGSHDRILAFFDKAHEWISLQPIPQYVSNYIGTI
jgi:hypothetical protein